MNFVNFIIDNWLLIVTVIAASISVVYSIFKGNKSVVMRMLVGLVTEAEKEYGGGTGALKLASVINAIYPKLPAVIKAFISEKTLIKWIEIALNVAKKQWEESIAATEYITQSSRANNSR